MAMGKLMAEMGKFEFKGEFERKPGEWVTFPIVSGGLSSECRLELNVLPPFREKTCTRLHATIDIALQIHSRAFKLTVPKHNLYLKGWSDRTNLIDYKWINPTKPIECQLISFDRSSNHLSITFRDKFPDGYEMLPLELLRASGWVPPPLEEVNYENCLRGRGDSIGEVFSVSLINFNNIEGEDPAHLYGTITLSDAYGIQYLYNRQREDCQSIKTGNDLLLIGPSRSIQGYDPFSFDVALMEDSDSRLFPDSESESSRDNESSGDDDSSEVDDPCGTLISCNPIVFPGDYDKLLSCKVKRKYGSVMVKYAYFRNAVAATVEVNGYDGEALCGMIAARASNFMHEIVLFSKEESEVRYNPEKHICMDLAAPSQLILLSRSVVAVPLNSSLLVQADLYFCIGYKMVIASGFAEFHPQLSGTSLGNISGKFGKIGVKVTWDS